MRTVSLGQCVTDAWLAGIPLAHIVSKMDEDGYGDACIAEAMELYDSLDDWAALSVSRLQATCPHGWREI